MNRWICPPTQGKKGKPTEKGSAVANPQQQVHDLQHQLWSMAAVLQDTSFCTNVEGWEKRYLWRLIPPEEPPRWSLTYLWHKAGQTLKNRIIPKCSIIAHITSEILQWWQSRQRLILEAILTLSSFTMEILPPLQLSKKDYCNSCWLLVLWRNLAVQGQQVYLKTFLGFCGYYRSLTANYSPTRHLLTNPSRDYHFIWKGKVPQKGSTPLFFLKKLKSLWKDKAVYHTCSCPAFE